MTALGATKAVTNNRKSHVPTRSSSLRHSTTASSLATSTVNDPPATPSTRSKGKGKSHVVSSTTASGAATTTTTTTDDPVEAAESEAGPVASSSTTTPTTRNHAPAKAAANLANLNSSPNGLLPPPARRVGPHGVPFLPPYTPVDTLCAFCGGTKSKNRHGRSEELVSCYECGSSGHPTCLEWEDTRIIKRVKDYAWLCQECKRCEVCDEKGDDDDMLFCDSCDRGWHRSCQTPPMTSLPRGKWSCPTCKSHAEFADGSSTIVNGPRKRLHVIPPKRPTSLKGNSAPRSERIQRIRRRSSSIRGDLWDDGGQFEYTNSPSSSRRHSVTGASARKDKKGKARESSFGARRGFYDPFADNDLGPRVITPSNSKKRKRDETDWMQQVAYLTHLDELEAAEEAANAEPIQHEDPWAGYLRPEQAETKGRVPNEDDRRRFKRAKDEVEERQLRILRAPRPPPTHAFPPSTLPPLQFGVPSHHSESHFSRMPALAIPESDYTGPHPVRSHLSPGQDHPKDTPQPILPSVAPAEIDDLTIANGIPIANISAIRFGEFEIETWYQAPFPEEYSRVADGRLWICEFCLRYSKGEFQASRHRLKCKTRHPPGDEIYRDGSVSVFEVDGRKNKMYCQNLCLLAKMFLDHKTLYYDVEPFLFYVMTNAEVTGAKFVGYFSKEKRSPTNNVSCIMTLPVRQRRGWGNLLIDFSYLLSKKEGRVGTPERPLSDLGLLSYRNYWTLVVCQYLHTVPNPESVTIQDISERTAMTPDDIYFVLKEQGWIVDTSKLPSPELVPESTEVDGTTGEKVVSTALSRKARSRFRGGQSGGTNTGGSSSRHQHVDDPHLLPTVKVPEHYRLTWDKALVEAHVLKWEKKQYLTLKPEKLQWSPFLVTRGFGLDANVGSTAKDGTAQMRAGANGVGRDGESRSPEQQRHPINIGALANGGGAQFDDDYDDGRDPPNGNAAAGPSRLATSALVNGAPKALAAAQVKGVDDSEESEEEGEEEEEEEEEEEDQTFGDSQEEEEASNFDDEDEDGSDEEEEAEDSDGITPVPESPPVSLSRETGRSSVAKKRSSNASEMRATRSRASVGGTTTNKPNRRLTRGSLTNGSPAVTNGKVKTPKRARSASTISPDLNNTTVKKPTRSTNNAKVSPELGRPARPREMSSTSASSADSLTPELVAGDDVIEETPDAALPVPPTSNGRTNGKGKQASMIQEETEEDDDDEIDDAKEDEEVAGLVGLTS